MKLPDSLHLRGGKEKLERLNAKAYIGDILKADTIDAAIGDFRPEIIINQITDLKMLIWLQTQSAYRGR